MDDIEDNECQDNPIRPDTDDIQPPGGTTPVIDLATLAKQWRGQLDVPELLQRNALGIYKK